MLANIKLCLFILVEALPLLLVAAFIFFINNERKRFNEAVEHLVGLPENEKLRYYLNFKFKDLEIHDLQMIYLDDELLVVALLVQVDTSLQGFEKDYLLFELESQIKSTYPNVEKIYFKKR